MFCQVEALQREVCVRNTYWQQQRQREDDFLTDLDSVLIQSVCRVTDAQIRWSGKQLRDVATELQDSAQTEVQRRAAQRSYLALILPPHVLHILTFGDEEEWDQQCVWHSTLMSGLDKLDVCVDQLQQDYEKWKSQAGDWSTNLNAMDKELRQRETLQLCSSRQTELDTSLTSLHFVRHLSQLRAKTAQAVLSGNFWFRDFGLVQSCVHKLNVTIPASLQQRALPLLERLIHLLEEKQPTGFSSNFCNQHISGFSTKQADCVEMPSRVWTASVPVGKGLSTQSLREPVARSQEIGLHANSLLTQNNSERQTASSGVHSQESQQTKGSAPLAHIAVPTFSEEQWKRLLELSPLFQLLKEVELQLKARAGRAGLLSQDLNGKGFMDVLDAQWECEGELIPLNLSVLNPREFLVYQHGLFLISTLHHLQLTPAVSLQIAASLPNNNYFNNAFRNSFFYQEAEEMLFVRRQRLQSVGGFSLMLIHCLSHIKIKDMSPDSSPAFQRLFFKSLQECLGQLFLAKMDTSPSGLSSLSEPFQEQEDVTEVLSDPHGVALLHRIHKPSRRLLSEDVEKMQSKHRETSLFTHVEGLLEDRKSGAIESGEDQTE
ncbi:putative LOC107380336-like protein [Nothobranchius furzeri]|uniref:LOC107380336-like protein n=1 Tax=Nothobranchius furzeri TaxID=105023 RepID=A0A9D2XB00_NOTFU|nr:putative LOC107380336-like protein [Nothobranchius furzeri]